MDVAGLRAIRDERFFANWDDYVPKERITASEQSIRQLIDDLIALGKKATQRAARRAVDVCVRRFNEMDDGWICTIEREDIGEQVGRVIDLTGFEYDEDWLDERDW
jgi:hypothetical protein